MPHYAKLHFRWFPGQKIDEAALGRMRENFPVPNRKPPVAWFLTGIEYYEGINNYKEMNLKRYLDDIRGGIIAFGRLKIWVDWFHHMLPFLIEKAYKEDDAELFQTIVQFMSVTYQHELYEEYLGFHQDIFNTLLKIIMLERFWEDGEINAPFWLEESGMYPPGMETSGIRDSLQFCIKYLPEQDMSEWVKSVTTINSKKWHEQVKFWLNEFKQSLSDYYIPEERAKLFFDEIRQYAGYEDM